MSVELRYMPCAEFELAIHGFVDDELSTADAKELLIHLELCDSCRNSVEAIRGQVRVHRESRDFSKMVESFNKTTFFQTLSGTLLGSNLERVADLLYELGKAYFVAGNDSKLVTFLHKKAAAIERTKAEGRRLVRETATLQTQSNGSKRKTAQSVEKAKDLFRGQRSGRNLRIGARSGRGALDNARRYLEECLILRPDHGPARLYLGVYFVRVDRPEEGIAEYRKLLSKNGLPPSMKVMALQAMGNAHAYRRDYGKAVRCFQEIVEGGIPDEDPRFFTVFLSLAMFHAKLKRFDRSAETFGELVRRFPQKLQEAREILDRAEVFRNLLAGEARFRTELLERYPMLFAG